MTCIRAGHPTWTGEETQICSEIAAALPEPSRMEIPPLLTDERAKIDVHCPSESVPARESLFLHALEIPEGIADVLKMETHTAILQADPLAAPVSEEVAVRTLTRFVTVMGGERFLLRSLGMGRKCKNTNSAPQ